MPLVTVVIPAYNAAEWIAETLKSVLQQTYQHLEVIVVDDGSTDRTVDIAERVLRTEKHRYQILRQENRGPSAARNRGWRSGFGSWIQFLDADDILRPDKIELQIAKRSDLTDVIYSDWQRLRFTGEIWKREEYVYAPVIGKNALADLLRTKNFIALGSQLFRSDVLRRLGGFDESHRFIEDVELHIKIAMENGAFVKALSNGPIFWYRDRAQSQSKSDRIEFIGGCIRNARMVERHLRETKGWSTEIVEQIVAVYYFGAKYFAEHDWARFEELVRDIEALHPGFQPSGSFALRSISRVFGYRNAERISLTYRRLKSLAGGSA